jgi:hypothetical protein
MLRITPLIAKEKAIFRLEGKLKGPWADELAKLWRVWRNTGLKRIRIILEDVTYIDQRGKDVLAELHREGAELVASDALASALLEELERINEAQTQEK